MNLKTASNPIEAKGRYYWELVFSYDNSDNTGTIRHKYKIKRKKTVNSKHFMSHKFDVNTGFTYKSKSSVSLKFDGVGGSSQETEFGYHLDLAYELVKAAETAETIEEETEHEREYEVGPGGKLDLYQLCYSSDGVSLRTDTVSTTPRPDVFIDLKFTCVKRILGLSDILEKFSHTFPRSSNKEEWKRIRDSIVEYSDEAEEKAFRHFVETLHSIHPKADNIVEWTDIRKTCGEILADWDAEDKQVLLKKLAYRFSITVPGQENRVEWEKIRQLSDEIIGIQQLSFR